jgi:hypothetical protein
MPTEQALTLKVANRRDFVLPVAILALLTVISALLSPQPWLLAILVLLVFATNRVARTLNIYKTSNVKLTLLIFPDGWVKIKSDRKDMIEGFLDGQQWCTHLVAVLRVVDKQGGVKKLVILSMQQQSADVFRRLNMWLRQNFHKDIQDKRGSLG